MLEITEMFFCAAIFGVVATSCIMAVKATLGKKWERKVLDEKEIVMQQMNNVNGRSEDVDVQSEDKEHDMTRN